MIALVLALVAGPAFSQAKVGSVGESCVTNADCDASLFCDRSACAAPRSGRPSISTPSGKPVPPMKGAQTQIVPYEEGMEIPPGAYVRTRNKAGLWGGGIALLVASWGSTWATTAVLCQAGCTSWAVPVSFIPVVGPFADAFISVPPVAVFMITMALIQAAGVGMIMGGALSVTKHLVLTGNGVQGSF